MFDNISIEQVERWIIHYKGILLFPYDWTDQERIKVILIVKELEKVRENIVNLKYDQFIRSWNYQKP